MERIDPRYESHINFTPNKMFNTRLSVTSSSVNVRTAPSLQSPIAVKAARQGAKVESAWMPDVGQPMSVNTFGGPNFTTIFQGIVPEFNETGLIPYYRDIYYHDPVAGAAVDISSTFPFSDMSLSGLESADLKVFNECLSRINVRTFMQEVSNNYLIDGQFTGSMIYDDSRKVFQDVLVHDALNTTVSNQPFHALDPVIKVNSAHALNQMFSSDSPYLDSILAGYPSGILNRFRQGTVVLDPLTTLFIPRRGAMDRTSVSYLKRIMPMYMLEKVLYRGTLTEAQKRQRPTSHIKAGDENWIPTDLEMQNILGEFQRSELDPLGAWIVTRQGVEVNEVRPPGDMWRWTDLIDIMVPYKLRALGISEAFLSGEASYATAEAAITVFLDSMDAYRQMLTYRIFTRKIFPIIAVIHGLYRDPSQRIPMRDTAGILSNLSNHKNLKVPAVNWFKSLNGKDTDSQWDMLDKLSEKGFTIPLKMWAAAASVDITSLMQDLEEDQKIKEAIENLTGKKAESIGVHEDTDESNFDDVSEDPGTLASVIKSGTKALSNRIQSRRVPLLAREMNPEIASISKSGKVRHSVTRESISAKRSNEYIVKALRNLQDPHYRATIRGKIKSKGIDL